MSGIVQVTPDEFDPERRILEGVDVSSLEPFKISEVARVFLGVSQASLRWHQREGHTVLNGTDWADRRNGFNNRIFTLADIEMLILALGMHRSITAGHMINSLRIVKAVAKIHGLIE